jgi:polyhydroxyalkanoate synthase
VEVWSRDKARLFHYLPTTEADGQPPPVLFVMSLVTTSLVFDLQEGNSLVGRFLDSGRQVYLLDWGVPDAVDSRNSLETYCDEYLPRAVRAVLDESGAEEVDLFCYCLGAVLGLLSVAGHPAMPVRSMILLATPVDMAELGPLTAMLRNRQIEVDDLLDWSGNVPAGRIKESFHLVEPAGEVTTYLSLWNSLTHPERLEAHQALVRWSSGHIPFPGAAFRQMTDLFIRDDALVRGQVRLGKRVVDLADVSVPVLSVTGSRDKLVPAASSAPLDLPGADLELLELEAGHAGLIVGRKAHREMIPALLAWLGDR